MDWNKLIETGLGSLGGSLINGSIGLVGNKIAHDQAMKDLDYQWNKMYSPQAQVRNMAAAGLNPAAAFGNQAPVISGSQMNLPNNPLGGIGTSSLNDISNYILSQAQAKKAGVETKGTELDNIVKSKTQEERIKEIGLRNKFTEEQTIKVINEWQKLVGEVNILQTESDIKKIDLKKHERLLNAMIDSYVHKANLDAAQEDSIRQQLPILLEKLQSESEVLSVDAEIAKDFKGTMTQLGLVGDAIKIIGHLVKFFK